MSDEHTRFGSGYEITDWGERFFYELNEPLKTQIEDARERMYAEMLNPSLRVRPKWTLRNRLQLAWSALTGRVTWDDIN